VRFLSIETFLLGLNNLRLHKLRSLLTSLGIIFGVAAVICMLSITEGASADEMRMLELLGTRNIIVTSKKPPASAQVSQGNTNLVEYGITSEDIARLKATIPHVNEVVPLKTVAFKARHGERSATLETAGTTPGFFEVVNVRVASGRALTRLDMQESQKVCVIGREVQEELFSFKDPLGETLLLERFPSAVPVTVVGVLERVKTAGTPRRGAEERNLNREVFIPYSTAKAQFGEITMRRSAGSREMTKVHCSGMYINVDEDEQVLAVS